MKVSILQLTILGMIATKAVAGDPIEDPQQKGRIPAHISDVKIHSRQKRSGKIFLKYIDSMTWIFFVELTTNSSV